MPTTIHADESQNLVMWDGVRLEGWIEDPPCPTCGGPRVYWAAYDATFCPGCNRWLELRCADPRCLICRIRPEAPLPAAPPGPVLQGAA
jgi:hypothetical protein